MAVSGRHLFTFAVVADTHMNQEEDYSSSPYPANALANARTRRVVAELNQADPEFVMHLGDIVNPVPELPTYEAAANHFKTLVKDLKAPLHLVAGNHDVGDKPVSWMPAGTVDAHGLALFQEHFGDHYYATDRNDLHLVVINAQLINSGLPDEETQRAWLEGDLAENADKRTMLFIHYPPYVSNRTENGSYDNIDEPGRTWLCDLIEKHKPEAIFCGHVHNFWYDRIGQTEMYILPSTAFVRHDYSEMYRIGPGDQWGRNDEPKLGYFLVRVYEQGHVIEFVRTYGRTLSEGEKLPAPVPTIKIPQTKEATAHAVGIDMRHAWADEMVVSPSGGVDEFERKLSRNDYPVLALWEMGLKRMRVPIQDILDARVRHRMEIMVAAGHLFHVYAYGVPAAAVQTVLSENRHLIERLEIVINWENAESAMAEITALKSLCDVPIYLSRVNRKDTNKHSGGRYNHLISHGFSFSESDELQAFFKTSDSAHVITGLMVSILRDVQPADAALDAARMAEDIGRDICLYVKSTSGSPADGFEDEAANAVRVAEAVASAMASPGIDVILDTFDDTDRGYFARSGLVDRRFNPKLGSRVVSHLMAALADAEWTLDSAEGDEVRTITLTGRDGSALLTLAGDQLSLETATRMIDLDSGTIRDV
jgi:predicted phosphodiesterase